MIKYLIMDVDGSLTDGKIYMGQNGEAMKAFSIKDGYVINYILKPSEIVPVIITARTSKIVQHRCNELGIKEVHQGKLDKLNALKEIVGYDALNECAYFGDDLIDLKCMIPIKEAGGIIGCPSDAVQEIKAVADYICINKAGEGALREFSEWLVEDHKDEDIIAERVQNAINYLKSINVTVADTNKKQIVNDDFFYFVQSYNTMPAADCKLESHRKYIDIQIMISGEEVMDIVDIFRLSVKEAYDDNRDVMFWKCPGHMARTSLKKGDCIVLYPENAHRCAISDTGTSSVLKIVGKVKAF
ncbi:MAG: YhcH/YjgK/YiaL family protein [Anaerostipes sp.]|jgi:YrbI family 3-deoxy-D-manno-octulosonate 8-phosphate phosphatase/YhcH/YjgK/YiaL family protein